MQSLFIKPTLSWSSVGGLFVCFDVLITGDMSKQAPNLKLDQSVLPSQQVLVLIAGIIHDRPVLDVSLIPLPPRSYLVKCGIRL